MRVTVQWRSWRRNQRKTSRALFSDWPLFKVGYLEIDVFALHPYHGFGGG
ncbi:MAG TPA: hypothetical protein VGG86_00350 [Roseiarcus sp.]|jgi:hypothetical protein